MRTTNMNINSVFTSNYLKAEDLKGRRVNVIIAKAGVEDINGMDKLILEFEGKDKKFVLNLTNARMIASLFKSDETKDWVGREITLRPDKTTFQGNMVDCLRVDGVLPGTPDDDDEVPF